MNVQIARASLVRDRMDWNRPHLGWLSNKLYRLRREVFPRR
ncbi:hypothetical protein SAMN04490244_10669 [Tranquillimonas rosea]|uniref:Uncharacterized protein n=1 Tax=Tranquillimonas rosea TaxID=641238 RepID=A0A1H9UWY5_9RHOB|nr:hypothetical protein [Tranquillimonas rosea]SES14060.1 hypothetical protein SAMN04490244_10669 [Tranquillimonas rosea]